MTDTHVSYVPDILNPEKQSQLWVARNGDKVPLRAPDLQLADVTDPRDWRTFQQVSKAIEGRPNLGPGFVLASPYVGIDLDSYKTTDPVIIAIHDWIHHTLLSNTYSEWSPRDGAHILCQGFLKCCRRKLSRVFVELKDEGYLTYTERAIHVLPVVNCQQSLDTLSQWVDRWFPAPSFESTSTVDLPEVNTDDEVCTMAANASNGELFKQLYQGNWQGRYISQSEADQALANIIAFYTDSRQQTARIFRSSQLGQRPKAQRQNYLYSPKYGLVTLAFDQKLQLPDLSDLGEKFKQLAETAAASKNGTSPEVHKVKLSLVTRQATPTLPPVTVQNEETSQSSDDESIQWPPGLLGNIARYIYQDASYPNVHVAVAGAIGMLAGLTGRAYNTVTGTGLNQYIILLGESGIGKEAAQHGTSKLCGMLRVHKDALLGYMGPAHIASPQALLRHLVKVQSMWSCLGEIGILLQSLNSPHANPNISQLKRLLLDLFHKSGQADILNGAIYADKTNNIVPVNAPAFSFIGDSTLDQFYNGIDLTNIHDGLVSRLAVIECPDVRPVYNPRAGDMTPSDALLKELETLVPRVCAINQDEKSIKRVDETPAAKAFQLQYQKFCQDKQWEDRSRPELQIWNRAHIKVLRLGSLVAVGKFPEHPTVELSDYQWAQKVIEDGVNTVLRRFESGNVGNTTLGFKQRQLIGKILLDYADSKWNQKMENSYRITKDMHQNGGIPYSYIQQRVKNMLPFALENHNAIQALTNAIESFIKAEALSEWETTPVEGNTRRKAMVYRIIDKSKLV